jgi:hypothetical protein
MINGRATGGEIRAYEGWASVSFIRGDLAPRDAVRGAMQRGRGDAFLERSESRLHRSANLTSTTTERATPPAPDLERKGPVAVPNPPVDALLPAACLAAPARRAIFSLISTAQRRDPLRDREWADESVLVRAGKVGAWG